MNELFSSVMVSNLVTGVAQVIILLGAASLMGFRTQAGVVEILVGMIAALLLVVTNIGFGLLTASISKSSNAATGIAFIFILPQMFLGSFVPAPESA